MSHPMDFGKVTCTPGIMRSASWTSIRTTEGTHECLEDIHRLWRCLWRYLEVKVTNKRGKRDLSGGQAKGQQGVCKSLELVIRTRMLDIARLRQVALLAYDDIGQAMVATHLTPTHILGPRPKGIHASCVDKTCWHIPPRAPALDSPASPRSRPTTGLGATPLHWGKHSPAGGPTKPG